MIEKRKLEILSHYSIIEDIKDSGKQLEIIFSPNAFETISGDKLFLLANQLFTKPAFKSLDNKITIKINKHDQWLNRLNEFIEDYIRRYPEDWFWLHNRWKWTRRFYGEQIDTPPDVFQ